MIIIQGLFFRLKFTKEIDKMGLTSLDFDLGEGPNFCFVETNRPRKEY